MLPTNLPLLLNEEGDHKKAVIEKMLREEPDTRTALAEIGNYWKIKVLFSEPVRLIIRGRYKRTQSYTFPGFFMSKDGTLCYNKGSRRGYPFYHVDKIIRYEVVPHRKKEFSSYEEFAKKFDRFFITEDQIKSLWNSKSSQHGGKYNRGDFRRLGPKGLMVMRWFLEGFKGIKAEPNEKYGKSMYGDYQIYTRYYSADHRLGRDIKLAHQTNVDMVYYSSEYHGMLNGQYGIVANRKEFLHLEND